jgi:hypothetical protein
MYPRVKVVWVEKSKKISVSVHPTREPALAAGNPVDTPCASPLIPVTSAQRKRLPNTPVIALCHDGKIVSLELPKVVEMAVAETTPVPKGATATNQMKDATLETGLRVRVPPFIEIGEVVRVNTDDGSYVGRAKG